jgi:hypothetical protein
LDSRGRNTGKSESLHRLMHGVFKRLSGKEHLVPGLLISRSEQQLKTMIEWSARHADYVDPLADLKKALGQFKNPPWHLGD